MYKVTLLTLLVNFPVLDSEFWDFGTMSKQFPDERPADEVFEETALRHSLGP